MGLLDKIPKPKIGLPDNKFDPNTDIEDLSGKVYVVTGGSAGIGRSS